MKIILFKVWTNYTESDQIFPHSASLLEQLVMKSMTHITLHNEALTVYHWVCICESIRESAETRSTDCYLLAQCSSSRNILCDGNRSKYFKNF